MLNNDCVFCKIIRGEIPSSKVYEDDVMLVFKDIEPKAKVHLLAPWRRKTAARAAIV